MSKRWYAFVAIAALASNALTAVPTSASHTPDGSLEGVVHTSAGALVEGATVDLLERDTQNVVATDDSGADGHYTIDAPSGTYDVRVLLPGDGQGGVRARQTTPAVEVDGDAHLDVFVEQDFVTVVGTVRDGAGAPMGDMDVVFFSGIGGTGEHVGPDGTFVAFIAPGHYDLNVRPGRSRPFVATVSVPVDIAAGDAPVYDLRFPLRDVTITAEDAAGNPATGVYVRGALNTSPVVHDVLPGVDGTGSVFANGSTDANGVAVLPVVETDSPLGLVFTAPNNGLYGGTTATLPGGATSLAVTLPATNAVTGVVTDAGGQPVAGASVSLSRGGTATPDGPVAYGSTDAAGAFALRAVPGDYLFTASRFSATGSNGYVSTSHADAITLSGDVTHDASLPSTAPITVNVTDAGGAPVANASVWVAPPYGSPPGDAVYSSGTANASGTIDLTGPASGDVQINVLPSPGFAVQRTFTNPGPSVTVALDPTTPVTGVFTVGGTPVAGASITVSSPNGRVTGTTSPDGSFALQAPAGDLRISASSPWPSSPNYFVDGPLAVPAIGRDVALDVPTSQVTLRNAGTFAFLNIGGNSYSPSTDLGFEFADGVAVGQWGLFVPNGGSSPIVATAVASSSARVYGVVGGAPMYSDLSSPRTLLFMRGVADDVPPTIDAVVSPAPNEHGWNDGPVTVSFGCQDDAPYAYVECPSPVSVDAPTSGETVSGVAVDRAGNRAKTSVVVRIDDTAPTISGAPDRDPNAAGWYRDDVTFSFTCDDDRSGVADCSSPVTLTGEGTGIEQLGFVSDNAGHAASTTVSADIDRTPPTIYATVEPSEPSSGWHTSGPVTVTFHCDDGLSGVASCPGSRVVDSEGATEVTGVVTDAAGWTASTSVVVHIDETPPSGAPVFPVGAIGGWYGYAPVVVPLECVDTLSGVASCPSASFAGEGAAQHQTVSVADVAGWTTDVFVGGVDIDLSAPDTAMASSLRLSLTGQQVTGTASDALSGVARVVVEYTSGRAVAQVEASVSCAGSACTWSAPPPSRPGYHVVKATAYDLVGHSDPTPATATVIVV